MVTLYRGTTKEFHDGIIRRKGTCTQKTNAFIRFIADITNFRIFDDIPDSHLHFSTHPSEAITFAILSASLYGAIPLLISSDSELLERNGINPYQISDTSFIIENAEIHPSLYGVINLVGLAEAWELHSQLYNAGNDKRLEEKILEEFLFGKVKV